MRFKVIFGLKFNPEKSELMPIYSVKDVDEYVLVWVQRWGPSIYLFRPPSSVPFKFVAIRIGAKERW